MKPSTFKRNLLWLRICITTFLLAILCLLLFSFTASVRISDDVWKQLGINQMQGTERIKSSFINNYFNEYGLKNAKNIAAGNRAAVAKDILAYTRQYVNSNVFKSEYEKAREYARPRESQPNNKSKESIRKGEIEETKKLIKRTEEIIRTSEGELKKTMEDVLAMHKANLKDYESPDSKMINMLWEGELNTRENDKKRYLDNVKVWEQNYPADYKQVIKMRLQKYLGIAQTVDFSAQLVEKNKKKYFVNNSYEAKNSEWKMIYRAGREVYDVTKVFAEQWLKDLEK